VANKERDQQGVGPEGGGVSRVPSQPRNLPVAYREKGGKNQKNRKKIGKTVKNGKTLKARKNRKKQEKAGKRISKHQSM
jgi:hypothetical protein